jgi:hypothetical protein
MVALIYLMVGWADPVNEEEKEGGGKKETG